MKTPELDKEIDRHEAYKSNDMLSNRGERMLTEFKAIKQVLTLTDVVSCFTCKFNNNDGKKEPICCHCSGNLDMHEPK